MINCVGTDYDLSLHAGTWNLEPGTWNLHLNILKKSVTADHAITGGGGLGFTARAIASGFYVGYAPVAGGTLGSLWGLVLCLLIPAIWLKWLWFSLPALFLLGVWSSGICEVYWGHDPGRVVIDEIVGMLITVVFLVPSAKILIAGFLLFRFFDVVKPPPIRLLEKLPGGWGVMMDDVIAGVYALVVLRALMHFLPRYV